MIDESLIYLALNVLVIIALLRLGRTILARRARTQIVAPKAKRDYSTATCPICGKFDASKPFISYAISCGRKDCLEP